jgi:hypothetical protein
VAWEWHHKVFLVLSFVFKTDFGMFLALLISLKYVEISGSPFSRNTLIPCSEKTSWSSKISFWNQKCPINSKSVIKNFFHIRLPCKYLNFMVLGYPSKKSQNLRNPIASEKLSRLYLSLLHKFSSKMMFLNSKKIFQTMGSEYSLRRDWKLPNISYRFETNQMW